MSERPVSFALPTGRSLSDCVKIIKAAGLPAEKLDNAGRLLVIDDLPCRYLLGKPSDIPMLVSQGAADIGLAGSDVISESGIDVAELIDTGMGRCFMAVAGTEETARIFDGHISGLMGMKVATKYVRTARRTFSEWGAEIKILNLNGSVELAPVLGISECIFDIVQTGETLRANGLSVIRKVFDVSLRLIANKGSMQLRWKEMRPIIEAIKEQTQRRDDR